jgi:putative phage-type endonuclease
MQQISTKDMPRDEWLKLRMGGLGGSDVAVALGLSKWKQPIELYYEKRGEMEPDDLSDNNMVQAGIKLEDVVAQWYVEITGLKVQRKNFMVFDEEDPFLYANIDRHVVGHNRVLECKTASIYTISEWGEGNTYDNEGNLLTTDTQIPDTYLMQINLYMDILGRDTADLAVLIGGNDIRIYSFERDEDLCQLMRKNARDFWWRVEEGIPPDIQYSHPSTAEFLKRRFADVDGPVVQFGQDAAMIKSVMDMAKEDAKQAQAVVDGCKYKLLQMMGNSPLAVMEDGTCWARKVVNKKEFTVEASSYVKFAHQKGKTAEKSIAAFTPTIVAIEEAS